MKYFLIIILTGLTLNSFCQDDSLTLVKLNMKRQNLKNEIGRLQDSLKKIDKSISYLESNLVLHKYGATNYTKAYLYNVNKVRKQPDPMSEIIGSIDPNVAVELIDFNSIGYWLIKSDNMVGFTSSVYLKMTDEIEELQAAFTERNELQMERELEKEKMAAVERQKNTNAKLKANLAQRKKNLIAKYGEKNGTRIFNGHYWLGMTDDMARESLGRPSDINRTVGSFGVHEQWVYYNTYLYFENGILTTYQN